MNEMRPVTRTDDEIARIREIVGRHAMPAMVIGFDVELGEFDGDPAMWIIFRTIGERPTDQDQRRSRVDALRRLREGVHEDLLGEFGTRYPYYRFLPAEAARHVSA